jgi:hypothetical protein
MLKNDYKGEMSESQFATLATMSDIAVFPSHVHQSSKLGWDTVELYHQLRLKLAYHIGFPKYWSCPVHMQHKYRITVALGDMAAPTTMICYNDWLNLTHDEKVSFVTR